MTTEAPQSILEPQPTGIIFIPDQPKPEDCLDFSPYVKALTELISSPQTKTPLTLGLFGTCGSGKTQLMMLIHRRLWFDLTLIRDRVVFPELFRQALANSYRLAVVVAPFLLVRLPQPAAAPPAIQDSFFNLIQRPSFKGALALTLGLWLLVKPPHARSATVAARPPRFSI